MRTNKIVILLIGALLMLTACGPATISTPAPGPESANPPSTTPATPAPNPPDQTNQAVSGQAPTNPGVPATPALTPAAFKTSGLTVMPPMVKLGELAMVSVIVTNTGGQSGNCTVVLKVDGNAEKTQNVTLDGGASQNVTFPLSSGIAGTHVVTIGENSGNLTVHAAAPEMPGKGGDCAAM